MPLGREKGRKCGECQFCCTALAIDDPNLFKYGAERCQHQCAYGCAIYQRRPMDCREFECLWLVGFGSDDERPDRVGYLQLLVRYRGEDRPSVMRVGPNGKPM